MIPHAPCGAVDTKTGWCGTTMMLCLPFLTQTSYHAYPQSLTLVRRTSIWLLAVALMQWDGQLSMAALSAPGTPQQSSVPTPSLPYGLLLTSIGARHHNSGPKLPVANNIPRLGRTYKLGISELIPHPVLDAFREAPQGVGFVPRSAISLRRYVCSHLPPQ